jgi:quinohemoprotein ethanol dehydrogenase
MFATSIAPAASRRAVLTRPAAAPAPKLRIVAALWCAALVSSAVAQGTAGNASAVAKRVDAAFIATNAAKTSDWPTYGLDYAETRFSKLNQVHDGNVKDLGLVWSYDLESTRGIEGTPLVVDGVMYVTAAWSVVHAIDVRSGKRLWTYDPKVPRSHGMKGCCDVVNRGVALWKGKVYVASFDGRLIALDAATGKKVWEKDTIIDRKRGYASTGAPRVFNGKVVIGNTGAEFGVRGYVTAYDADTGAQKWRWFTVPGDPSKPFENEAMAKAAKTWDPAGRYWEVGGGGVVWDTMTYDPELNLMYIGTGNGTPWSWKKRSPAGGDNLYLAALVALDPDTGKYVWHYQETPEEDWDYDAASPMVLADLQIDGKARKVILHAQKSGFFFVIDRTNGRFISAKNFVDVNWATGYDKNGRPLLTPEAHRSEKPTDNIPGPFGARSWHPGSFNPQTGLYYLSAQNVPMNMMDNKDWTWRGARTPGEPMAGMGWNLGKFANVEPPQGKPFGRLIAWDPVAQKEAWRQELISPWNGGTLTTAGNLVFQGTADARLIAYNAKSGDRLWETPVGSGAIAPPVTYEVDGKQYVSIAVGWGGVYGQLYRASERQGPGTVYTYALGGTAKAPDAVPYRWTELVSGVKYDPEHVKEGTALYVNHCVFCHGVPGVDRGGSLPNLAFLPAPYIENLQSFVFKGPATERGMPDFTGKLTPHEVDKIKAFILGTADAIRPKK